MTRNHRKLWAALVLLMAFVCHVRGATVTATLDPAQISMGDTAQLTVTVTGAQDQATVPNVDGLDITPVGQSTQIEVINGSITANTSDTFTITPQREGTFVIPAIHAGNAASQPVTLRVTKGTGMASAPAPSSTPQQNGPVVLPPQAAPPSQESPAPVTQGRYGTLQVTLPKRDLYEGELVPIDIKAYIPDELQANVTDLPQFTSDGFTMNSLSTKPQRSEQAINGRLCTVLTWHTALTAVKTGDYPFSLQMPETVIVPQQRQQSGDDDDFVSNIFRNAFASMGTKKNVTLQTEPATLRVLPLPQANRPADFSGAVGQFEVDASATPIKVSTGDPITLRMVVTGTGNFDRVSSDMLGADAQWKTYSPKSHFDAQDSVGYQGAKTFEQPVIPNDGGITSIPSLTFSFFDPEKKQYVTRTTPPIPVTVSGSSLAAATAPNAPPTSSSGNQPQPPATPSSPVSDDGLRAIKMEPGSFVSSLRPVYLNPWFIAGQGLPLLALLGGLLFIQQRRLASHPERTRSTAVQRAIREQVDAMDAAMQNQQTDAFFIHARAALQQRLGQQWNMRPETITLAEVERHLGEERENIRPIFEMADQASYSDLHFADADLRQWRDVVLSELAEKN